MDHLEYLQKHSKLSLVLIWHENRSSYLSCRIESHKMVIRLHRMFAPMPMLIWKALVSYIFQKDKKARIVLKKAAHEYFSSVYLPPKPLLSKGSTHHLLLLYDKVQQEYFPSMDLKIEIGWAKKQKRSQGRCMTFGCFDSHQRQIRIHPSLDHPSVPAYFVEFVIYHEILHAILPSAISPKGRIQAHTKEFRSQEKLFFEYEKAKSFEKTFFNSVSVK